MVNHIKLLLQLQALLEKRYVQQVHKEFLACCMWTTQNCNLVLSSLDAIHSLLLLAWSDGGANNNFAIAASHFALVFSKLGPIYLGKDMG